MRRLLVMCVLATAAGCGVGVAGEVGEAAQNLKPPIDTAEDGDVDTIGRNGLTWECFLQENYFERNHLVTDLPRRSLEGLIDGYFVVSGESRDPDPECTQVYLSKLVQAALRPDQKLFTPWGDMPGGFGNGHWLAAPIDLKDQQRITAGMLALVNTRGEPVKIWVRSPVASGRPQQSPWDTYYDTLEGSYSGNLFAGAVLDPELPDFPRRDLHLFAGPGIPKNSFIAMRCGNAKQFQRYYAGAAEDAVYDADGIKVGYVCERSFTGYDRCAAADQIVTTWVPAGFYRLEPRAF